MPKRWRPKSDDQIKGKKTPGVDGEVWSTPAAKMRGVLTLTDKGYEIASSVYNRHKLLTRFFVALGVNEQTAQPMPVK